MYEPDGSSVNDVLRLIAAHRTVRRFEPTPAHDEDAARYYAERGQPGRTWSGGTWRKFQRRLREHLLEYYRSKGARFE